MINLFLSVRVHCDAQGCPNHFGADLRVDPLAVERALRLIRDVPAEGWLYLADGRRALCPLHARLGSPQLSP